MECAGLKKASAWGAAVGAAMEYLVGSGFVYKSGMITEAGREELVRRITKSEELSFADVTRVNFKRCEASNGFNHPINGWSLSDWMTALAGEVGEAANIIKKMNRHRDGVTNPGDPSMIELTLMLSEELADVDLYLDLIFQRAQIDRPKAVRAKFNKTSEKIGAPHRL